MARAQRQKRESTAAYAASQPLFDALRNGTSRITEQEAHLTQARDTVQQLHVKLVNTNGVNDQDKHDHYMDCAVKAWRSATETYSAIFDELANVTAADASEGRDAGKRHEEFKSLARSAAAEKTLAMSFALANDNAQAKGTPTKRARVEDEQDEDDESDDAASSEPTPQNAKKDRTPSNPHLLALHGKRRLPADEDEDKATPAKTVKLSDKGGQDVSGKKVLWERGPEKLNVPFATLGADEKKAWKAEKARQKREKNRAKKAGSAPTADPNGTSQVANGSVGGDEDMHDADKPGLAQGYIPLDAEPVPVSAGKENAVPVVEYEDVSAEVEVRLKAKEDRKKAKKSEKKRKRESGDSMIEPAPIHVVPEKPVKKRPKFETVAGGQANGLGSEKVEKRKSEAANADEAAGGRKKRKKGRSF